MAFLESWLEAASTVLGRAFAGNVRFLHADQLPSPESVVAMGITVTGSFAGRLTVLIDWESLSKILVATKKAGPEPDQERDLEIWRKLLWQVAAGLSVGMTVTSIESMTRPRGAAIAAYQLHFGDHAMLLALIDEAQPVEMTKLVASVDETQKLSAKGFDLLLDVEIEASLRFGSREMPLHEVLELGPGDVVELDRHVADPVDLIVGDKIVARGEVVLVNGNFGLRVSEVAEPKKCLESIRCLF